ncbi:Carbonic anhydrase [Pseudomonas viridiflava]|nr:Carbonic anhydrase [Pseudomonas viridiflava]
MRNPHQSVREDEDMRDMDKQPSATSASTHSHSDSADVALKHIVDGFVHFRKEVFPQQEELFKKLATAQSPRAMFITCADSRIVPELITQSSPGDLFVTRNVGNVVPPYGQMNGGVSTALEYAVVALGVQHIIVCGHSDCGAMRAVLNPDSLDKMPTVKAWLRHAEVARTVVEQNCSCSGELETMQVLTQENVISQLQHLRTHPSVAAKMASGQLFIHGWVYSIETSEILAYDAESDRFVPLDGSGPTPMASPKARFSAD